MGDLPLPVRLEVEDEVKEATLLALYKRPVYQTDNAREGLVNNSKSLAWSLLF